MDTEISSQLFVEIRKLIRAIERNSSRLSDKHGITVPQLVVMREIYAKEYIDAEELRESLNLDAKTINEILDRLYRIGLVVRYEGREERDKFFVTLTDKGRDVLVQNPTLIQDTLASELDAIEDWQQNMLLSSFQRINSLLEIENLDASPILTPGAVTEPEPAGEGKVKQILRPEKEKVDIFKATNLDELDKIVQIDKLTEFTYKHMKPFNDTVSDTKLGITHALTGVPDKGGFVLVAKRDDEVVGCLVMLATGMKNYIPSYCVLFVGVNSSLRGLGIGQQIMEVGIKEADGDIYLHVDYDNPAKRLYERLGFQNKYAEMRFYKKKTIFEE